MVAIGDEIRLGKRKVIFELLKTPSAIERLVHQGWY
jgi:hypothetical protein